MAVPVARHTSGAFVRPTASGTSSHRAVQAPTLTASLGVGVNRHAGPADPDHHRRRHPGHSWWWPAWWYWGSGWGFGYQGHHWSIWLSDWWPRTCTRVQTVYVERPVVVYQPAPVVRVVDTYDDMDRLIDRLKYGSVDQRKAAAKELGYQNSYRALYPLVYALEYDTDSTVRYLAAKALGKLGFSDALPALRKAAESDPDEVVRTEAQDSIDRILGAV